MDKLLLMLLSTRLLTGISLLPVNVFIVDSEVIGVHDRGLVLLEVLAGIVVLAELSLPLMVLLGQGLE